MSKRILAILALATGVAILGLLVADSGRGDDGKHAASARMVKAWLDIRPEAPTAWKSEGKFDQAEFDFYKRRAAAYVKSPVVLRAVLDDPKVQQLAAYKNVPADDRMGWLEDTLVVEFPGDSSLMTIAMPDDANHDAAKIVDAAADELLDMMVNRERTEKLNRRDALEKKLYAYKSQLAQKRTEFHEMTAQLNEQSKSESLAAKSELANYSQEFLDARNQKTEAELHLDHAKLALAQAGGNTADRLAAKKNIEACQAEIQFWTDKIAAIKKQIDERTIAMSKEDRFNSDLDALSSEIQNLNHTVGEMEQVVMQWNIELDAPSRIAKIADASR